MSDFWTVVETGDAGEPIIAVCRTEDEARRWADAYESDPYYFGAPEVRGQDFAGPYVPKADRLRTKRADE